MRSGAAVTPSVMVPEAVRLSESLTDTGRDLLPVAVPLDTVTSRPKTLSPAAPSPCAPSSNRDVPAAPPMALVSTVTARLLLAGFVPGATVTARWVVLPAGTEAGAALAALTVGEVGVSTVRAMLPLPLRDSPSLTLSGSDLLPGVAAASMVTSRPNSLSPAAPSPCAPSSNRDTLPPLILDRSALTVSAVLGGLAPGITSAFKWVVSVTATDAGVAVPETLGGVAPAVTSSAIEPMPLRACASLTAIGSE